MQWNGVAGWEYELESSSDLSDWQSEGIWSGTDGLIDLTVYEALPGGGQPPAAGPDLDTYTFRVSAYSDGNSLLSWI